MRSFHYCADCDTHFRADLETHAKVYHESGLFNGIEDGDFRDYRRRTA